jgi:hypothetical protein
MDRKQKGSGSEKQEAGRVVEVEVRNQEGKLQERQRVGRKV